MTKTKKTIAPPTPQTFCSTADHGARVAQYRIDGTALCDWCIDASLEAKLTEAARLDDRTTFDLYQQGREVVDTAETLSQHARNLGDYMTRFADRLAATPGPAAPWVGPFNTSVNSCGEVQGRGLDVDLLCQKLDMLRRAYGRARYAWAKTQPWFASIDR